MIFFNIFIPIPIQTSYFNCTLMSFVDIHDEIDRIFGKVIIRLDYIQKLKKKIGKFAELLRVNSTYTK